MVQRSCGKRHRGGRLYFRAYGADHSIPSEGTREWRAALNYFLQWAALAWVLLSHGTAQGAAVISISEPPDGSADVITVATTGIPAGVPGITVVSATFESINFTYDDGIPSTVTAEFDRLMLETDGSPSDLFVWFGTEGSSVENVFFFSDDGGNLPRTCTPSVVCTVLPAITEDGTQQTMLDIINPATGALLTRYTAASDLNAAPEPATYLLFGVGLAGLAGAAWRRHRRKH